MAEGRNQNQGGQQNRGSQGGSGSQGQQGGGPQGKMNLNQASKEELRRIEGVGDHVANDIVRYREDNGGFKNHDQLREIGGIDDEMEQKIRKFTDI